MGAQSVEGTGPGSATRLLPPILNGVVKNENIEVNALVDYRIDVAATGNVTADGYMYASGSVTAGTHVYAGGNAVISGNITAGGNLIASGNISAGGDIQATGFVRGGALGQTLNTSFWTSSGNITTSSSGYVQIATGAYTPISNSSFLNIEYHAAYTVDGSGSDVFRSRITVDGNEVTYRTQTWMSGGSGQDIRGGILLPIAGVTTNANLSGKIIAVEIEKTSGDDTLTVDRSSSMLKLTEVKL